MINFNPETHGHYIPQLSNQLPSIKTDRTLVSSSLSWQETGIAKPNGMRRTASFTGTKSPCCHNPRNHVLQASVVYFISDQRVWWAGSLLQSSMPPTTLVTNDPPPKAINACKPRQRQVSCHHLPEGFPATCKSRCHRCRSLQDRELLQPRRAGREKTGRWNGKKINEDRRIQPNLASYTEKDWFAI